MCCSSTVAGLRAGPAEPSSPPASAFGSCRFTPLLRAHPRLPAGLTGQEWQAAASAPLLLNPQSICSPIHFMSIIFGRILVATEAVALRLQPGDLGVPVSPASHQSHLVLTGLVGHVGRGSRQGGQWFCCPGFPGLKCSCRVGQESPLLFSSFCWARVFAGPGESALSSEWEKIQDIE